MSPKARFFIGLYVGLGIALGGLVQFNLVRIGHYLTDARRMLVRVAAVDQGFLNSLPPATSATALLAAIEERSAELEGLRTRLNEIWCPGGLRDAHEALDSGLASHQGLYLGLDSWVRTGGPKNSIELDAAALDQSPAELEPGLTDDLGEAEWAGEHALGPAEDSAPAADDNLTDEAALARHAADDYRAAGKRLGLSPRPYVRLAEPTVASLRAVSLLWAAKRAWQAEAKEFLAQADSVLAELNKIRAAMTALTGRALREQVNEDLMERLETNVSDRYRLLDRVRKVAASGSLMAAKTELVALIEASPDLCYPWMAYAEQRRVWQRHQAAYANLTEEEMFLYYLPPPPPEPDPALLRDGRRQADEFSRRQARLAAKLNRVRALALRDPNSVVLPLRLPKQQGLDRT